MSRFPKLAVLIGLGLPAAALAPEARAQGAAAVVDSLRRASVGWERRPGPDRQVVDVVCLVPDVPTFFEALATWDDHHVFPILIDDVELTFKFLRAFRPARIVRFPGGAAAITPETAWERATSAVGRSWVGAGVPKAIAPKDAGTVPETLGPTPPGLVLAAPDSPLLAGAAALAAGRFQPLVRFETPRHYADVLSNDDARTFVQRIETLVATHRKRYDQLGDDCDFLTLCGDYPYRYATEKGEHALDDLIGRFPGTRARWAFCGRLLGDDRAGVYQAMCSLFLQPRSALLFNTYAQTGKPWTDYTMDSAVSRLDGVFPVVHRAGDRAGLPGWHETFDPVNRFGLVFINTHGDPAVFHLPAGPGQTADVPASVPAAVFMVHSFSAANPADPQTLAGRWLANGAFVYYGSITEPYLQSFRPPGLLTALLAEHVPFGAAARESPPEPFGTPWRLIYLGDPLYRIDPRAPSKARLARWDPIAGWPAYEEYQPPRASERDDVRLHWVMKTALFRFRQTARPTLATDFLPTLLGIDRAKLAAKLRPLFDALLIDSLEEAQRVDDLRVHLTAIPVAVRSPAAQRALETCRAAVLQTLLNRRDFPRALALWDETIREPGAPEYLGQMTARVAGLADTPPRIDLWRARLRDARAEPPKGASGPVIEAELKRLEDGKK